MDGIININKPPGITSFDVVARVKRLAHERRVGHAGTLDPLASGVLPVCLGRATRVVEYLADALKVYRAVIELGVVTDTYDADGKVVSRCDSSGVSRQQVETVLDSFRGSIQQTPPMYSALKHKGQPLYRLARDGIEVERKSRTVSVSHLELLDWRPPLVTLEVECSKGTYIRSLAHDLGQRLGCGAMLKALVRTGYGVFLLENSVSLESLAEAFQNKCELSYIQPVDIVLTDMPALIVSPEIEPLVKSGRPLDINENGAPASEHCRVYSTGGVFLGILRLSDDRKQWQPEKIFV